MTTEANHSSELDDDHPLWLVNAQIVGLLEGDGADEDHESVLSFLRATGLPEGTIRRVHAAVVCSEKSRVHRLHPNGLDPVVVYVEQCRPGASRITVQCYAQAWTAYWGSHGKCPVEQFVVSCDADYVIDNLVWGTNGLMLKSREKSNREYLRRIVKAIQEHFKANCK